MQKRILLILTAVITLSLSMLVGCGNQQEANNNITEQPTTTEATEPPHEHTYIENITKEATCTEAGEKAFTCDCGDTYTEVIEATGHSYGEYRYNNDATTEKDGTETATCSACGKTKTRTKEGTKLEPVLESFPYALNEPWYDAATDSVYFYSVGHWRLISNGEALYMSSCDLLDQYTTKNGVHTASSEVAGNYKEGEVYKTRVYIHIVN